MTAMNKILLTDENLKKASEVLKANSSWSIFTHRKADGDAIGSASALYEMGINSGKQVKWYSPDTKLPETYKFLSCFDKHIYTEKFDFAYDGELYIFLDCSNEARSVEGYSADKNINSLNIDHHEDNSFYGRVNCVDGFASSTSEVLFRLFRAGKWDITKNIAESLYTGIFTDSGGFTFSNTSPLTHRIAAELIELGVKSDHVTDLIMQNKTPSALIVWAKAFSRIKTFGNENMFAMTHLYSRDFIEAGANMTETEGLPNMLMSIRGVKFAACITENFSGDIRVSFRSREGSPLSAGVIARLFGGGGHERAAGATLKGKIDECANKVEAMLLSKYHECSCADQ